MPSFTELIRGSNLEESDKQTFLHAHDFLHGKCLPHFTSRSILLMGDTGIGKTYLAEQLLSACEDWRIIAAGATRFSGQNVTRCSTMKEVVSSVKSTAKTAVLIDDLDYVMERKDGEYIFTDKKELMELLEELKLRPDTFLIVTVNNVLLEPELFDRFDAKIDAELPSDTEKTTFLANTYSTYMPPKLLKKAVTMSIGHNFRDLAEATRMAYRFGNRKINLASLTKAFMTYKPSGLRGFDVERRLQTRFNDLVGQENVKNKLKLLMVAAKNFEKSSRLGLKRQNMLLFTGPNGTGKTLMAQAFAGELNYPLIKVGSDIIYSPEGAFHSLKRVFGLAKRYKKSVVVFDEADKTLGRARLEDDTTLIGAMNDLAEAEKEPKAFIILIANNDDRLGAGLADRFTKISFDYPKTEDRAMFFSRKIEHAKGVLDRSIGSEELARATEGQSFREMEKLWEEIVQHYLETNKSVSYEKFLEILNAMEKEEKPLTLYG